MMCTWLLLQADVSSDAAELPVDSVQFIDFEYCCTMQRGFDWVHKAIYSCFIMPCCK